MTKRRYILLLLLLTILTVGVTLTFRYRTLLFPSHRVSPLYERYQNTPGISAGYIKDFRVDCSVRIEGAKQVVMDVDLLQASDSASFAMLLADMGKSDEFIHDIMSLPVGDDVRFTSDYLAGGLSPEINSKAMEYTLVAVFPASMKVVVFYTLSSEDNNLIAELNYFDLIEI